MLGWIGTVASPLLNIGGEWTINTLSWISHYLCTSSNWKEFRLSNGPVSLLMTCNCPCQGNLARESDEVQQGLMVLLAKMSQGKLCTESGLILSLMWPQVGWTAKMHISKPLFLFEILLYSNSLAFERPWHYHLYSMYCDYRKLLLCVAFWTHTKTLTFVCERTSERQLNVGCLGKCLVIHVSRWCFVGSPVLKIWRKLKRHPLNLRHSMSS